MRAFIKRFLLEKILKSILVRRDAPGNKVFLTFDDGPHPENTDKILAVLREHGVRATFFVVGEEAERYPDVARRVVEAGHEVDSHGWSHVRFSPWDFRGVRRNVERAEALLESSFGVRTRIYRPPYGHLTVPLILQALRRRMRVVLWSVMSGDDHGQTADGMAANCRRAKAGDILLFHDDNPDVPAALPRIIRDIRGKGLDFGVVGEIAAEEGAAPAVPAPGERVDESHPAYRAFLRCYEEGAAAQDIYGERGDGFGYRRRRVSTEEEAARRRAHAREEFEKMFRHRRNLAEPLAGVIELKQRRVLDFGCGTGALSAPLALLGARVTAADPTPASLKAVACRRDYWGLPPDSVVTVQIPPRPGLPFPDESFDAIVANSVFEFIPYGRDLYIRDFFRLLKPGGHLVISSENGLFPSSYYTGLLLPYFRPGAVFKKNIPYGPTYFELRRWIAETGFAFEDLSLENRFNSLDKLTRRLGASPSGKMVGAANGLLKDLCRRARIPSDLLLPYATYIFRKRGRLVREPERAISAMAPRVPA